MFTTKLGIVLKSVNSTFRGITCSRLISTKPPKSSTAAAPKLQEDISEDAPAHHRVDRTPSGDQRQRWVATDMKGPTREMIVVEDPVHTCQTLEEFTLSFREGVFSFAPDAGANDTLPVHEWRSFFHLFTYSKGMSVENIQFMRTILAADIEGLKKYNENRQWNSDVDDQLFRIQRTKQLGADLAAAHFLVFREGRVKFHGQTEWIEKDDIDDYNLPGHKVEGLYLQQVDMTKVIIHYEGLENLSGCTQLEHITLSDNKMVDNWSIDRICCQHHESLKSLDISYCPNITMGAITALSRLSKLETLNVEGLNIPHLQLVCLTLEDELPGLTVVGLDQQNTEDISDSEVEKINLRLRTETLKDLK